MKQLQCFSWPFYVKVKWLLVMEAYGRCRYWLHLYLTSVLHWRQFPQLPPSPPDRFTRWIGGCKSQIWSGPFGGEKYLMPLPGRPARILVTTLTEVSHSTIRLRTCCQEIPRILWNPKVLSLVHKSPPLDPKLCQLNPIHVPHESRGILTTINCYGTIILINIQCMFYYFVLWPTNAQLFHKSSHSYMFRHYRVILRELAINTLTSCLLK